MLAMEETPKTIYGSKILITGFGRISKVMVLALRAMGAELYVAARKCKDIEWAKIYGCNAVDYNHLDAILPQIDIVFNTVPVVIFEEKWLKKLQTDCLIIDLASKPGGIDFKAASQLGLKAIWALSLPGKVAPVTAGKIICDTILYILSERGEV